MTSVPKYGNFTMEQVEDSEGCRAMQCGRRMFLAALVLASKYLQDRNYSTRAWGKISGLQVSEINTNERVFLSAVNWKLHIPEPLFQRWERVVLKYSPSASASRTPRSCPIACRTWQSIIPQLNPDLDQFDDKGVLISDNDSGYYSSSSCASSRDSSPHAVRPTPEPAPPTEPIPTDPSTIPRFLEPAPYETKPAGSRMLPPLQPREGPLPTPTFTPRNPPLCTPAVSASGLLPRTSAMAMAMAQNRRCWDESLLDKRDSFGPRSSTSNPSFLRPFSRTSTTLSESSSPPESIVWDQSRNPSRSSSISSVASSASAFSKPDLAWQAIHRSVNMQSSTSKGNRLNRREASREGCVAWKDPFLSRNAKITSDCGRSRLSFMAEDSTPSPFDRGKQSYEEQPTPSTIADETTPRATRSHSPNTEIPCRKTYDAAVALCELDLGPKPYFISRPQPTSDCRSRKRERPRSIDLTLQSSVRDIIAPRHLGDISQDNNEEAIVLPDEQVADSLLLRRQDGPAGHNSKGLRHDLRWLAAEEDRRNRKAAEHVANSEKLFETDSDSNFSAMPRKKTCVLAAGSELGKKGLSVRRCGGNSMPVKAARAADVEAQPMCSQNSRLQSRPVSRGMALKENQSFHARSTSYPSVKSSLGDPHLRTRNSGDNCLQASGAELDRMLRASGGESIDDRLALRGGKLWGEIS